MRQYLTFNIEYVRAQKAAEEEEVALYRKRTRDVCWKFTTDVSDIIFSRARASNYTYKTGRINLANKFPLVKNKLWYILLPPRSPPRAGIGMRVYAL